jgi:subtilisin family serine protease
MASLSAIRDALSWVADNHVEQSIAAINLSFALNDTGDRDTLLEVVSLYRQLSAEGVLVVASSGNAYGPEAQQVVSQLAQGDDVVSVGAVWDSDAGPAYFAGGSADYTTGADRITSFTQRATGLDLLAPGGDILGLRLGSGLVLRSGTSMAAPMVASAGVLLREAADRAGVSLSTGEILEWLQMTGESIFDGDDENDNVLNTNRSYRRLDIGAAVEGLNGSLDEIDSDDTEDILAGLSPLLS